MGKYKALQTHKLLLAKHNDENDFELNLNTLQEKDEAGPKLARHHFETCNMRKAVTTLPESGTRFLVANLSGGALLLRGHSGVPSFPTLCGSVFLVETKN